MKKVFAFLMLFVPMPLFAIGVDANEPKTIKSEKIEYDVKSGNVKTSGKTEITNASGQRMTLTDSYMSKNGDDMSGKDVQIWLGQHVYIKSDNITHNGPDTIAKNAEFTACDGCDTFGNAWAIWASKITHNMDERMLSFYNMVFKTYDLPVLWLPYYTMPDPGVKHKSGFLMPSFGSTNKMGTQINIPVYINFSDYHDATVTFSYLTKENPLFQLEHRLNLSHAEFRTRGSFTHNKEGDNRWHIFNNDRVDLGEHARASVYIARTSDKTYLQKYGFFNSEPYLDSGVKLELFESSGYIVADTHDFQELREGNWLQARLGGNILPNIRGVYQTKPFFKETYATFGTDVLGIVGDGTMAQRVVGDARITSPWTLLGGNRFTASLDVRYDVYNFDNTIMTDNSEFSGLKTRFLPSGYVEWGLPLVRPSSSWSQTLEPRARLTMRRRVDDEQFAKDNDSVGAFLSDTVLFSDNRFSGYDLWENGTFADYGLRWAAFNPDGRQVEVFLGESYDFSEKVTDRNSGFHTGRSDYVGRIGFSNSRWLTLSERFRFDRDTFDLRHSETSARIGRGQTYLSLGHIWAQQLSNIGSRDNNTNESTVGAGLRLSDRWSLQVNGIYNWTEENFLKHNATLFYNHPCYYFSIGYQRDNAVRRDYSGNTTFQFRFGISIDGQHY